MANAVEMSTMRKLVAQLNQYRHEYYNLNAPSVADDVYDYMYDELLALEEHTGVCMANSPTQTVGYPVEMGISARISRTTQRRSPAFPNASPMKIDWWSSARASSTTAILRA